MSIDYSDEGRSADRGEVLLSTSVISEDEKEYSLRPQTLSEYIGQEKAKRNLEVFIEGARKR